MAGERYSHASHTHKVLMGSAARCAAFNVLQYMCRRAEFDVPQTTVTKAELCRACRYTLKTVKAALAELRAEGSIVPIRCFEGGRGNAVTYRLDIVGQDRTSTTPAPEKGRKCPPLLFSKWNKYHGSTEAFKMKKRYEAGEEVE